MRLLSRAVLALAAVSTLAACEDDTTAPTQFGYIRAVHAVSDVATMDVLLNSSSYKADVAYKATDGYKDVVTGANAVKFREDGATTDLVAANVTVANGVDYTVIAVGTEDDPETIVLTDNNAAPAAGKVKFRFVHGIPGAAAADVYVLANIDDLEDATPVKAGLAAKAASDYIVRDAGTFVVVFTEPGTKTPLLTLSNLQRAAGHVGTIVLVEKAGGGEPLEGIVLTDMQ